MLAYAIPIGQFYFEELGPIGAGGLGRVDKIRITATNEPRKPIGSIWARKRLNQQWDANPIMRARFEREIAALRSMTHNNIVTCEGENLSGQPRFYLMPFFDHTVRGHIAGGSWRGKWRDIAGCVATIADALSYAHQRGVFHRDIKPDNLLFIAGGPLVVADWGIGYFVHQYSKVLVQLTKGGMGTEYYCSLEQWSTGKCDERGDIYSLGMTIDEWVTGQQRPIRVGFGLSGPATADRSPGAVRFNNLLMWMTQFDRSRRPSNMSAVATELRKAIAEG